MTNFIGFEITKMEHLNYHWFWGLQYQMSSEPTNLATSVKALLQNDEALKILQGKMRSLFQQNGIIRFVYRLFNINNYTYHSYLLAACKLHQNYLNNSAEQSSDMNEENNLSWMGLAVGLAAAMAAIDYLLKPTKTMEISPFANQSHDNESCRAVVGQKSSPESSPISPKNQKDIIRVTEQMKPHLILLGMEQNVGDDLNITQFKVACRNLYKASHPDKGGSAEKFRKIKEAAERVIHLMSSREIASEVPSYERNTTKYWDFLYAKLDDLIAMNAAYNAKVEADISELKAAHGRNEEAHARNEEAHARSEEAHARSEEAYAKIEAVLAKCEIGLKELQKILDNKQDASRLQVITAPRGPGMFAASPNRELPAEEKLSEESFDDRISNLIH